MVLTCSLSVQLTLCTAYRWSEHTQNTVVRRHTISRNTNESAHDPAGKHSDSQSGCSYPGLLT